jgi:HemX protein
MIPQSWMYDAIIYIYALSLLFYFSDFARPNREAKRMGTGLLLFVWALQTLFLAFSIASHIGVSTFSTFETLFMLSWLLVTVSIVVGLFIRIELFVFIINVIGFAILALNFFSNPDVSPMLDRWGINDELLFIHISLSIGSYAAFVASSIFSGMYLFLHGRLKGKKWTAAVKRLPSLEKMDQYAYVSVVIGAPLFLLGLSLGLVWISLGGNYSLFLDPKVIASWIVLLLYVFYLFQRLAQGAPGNKLAVWNLFAFCLVVLNYLLTNFSAFHQWS